MEVKQEMRGEVICLTLKGMLDTLNSGKLGQAVQDFPDKGKDIEIDMLDVSYISSAGLRAILQILEVARGRGGKIRIVRPSSFVREVLTTVGFDSLVEIA